MSDAFERALHKIPYTHRLFRPGMMVWIDPRIIFLHPLCPGIGRYVSVTVGTYLRSDLPDIQRWIEQEERADPHEKHVPVIIDGHIWLIEEDYVFAKKGEGT